MLVNIFIYYSWLVPDAADTVICATDDGWRNHPKYVEQFTRKINCLYLHLVGQLLTCSMGQEDNGHKHRHKKNCFYFKINAEKSPWAQQRSFQRSEPTLFNDLLGGCVYISLGQTEYDFETEFSILIVNCASVFFLSVSFLRRAILIFMSILLL